MSNIEASFSVSARPSNAPSAGLYTETLTSVPPKPLNISVSPIAQSVGVPAIISHGKSLVYGTPPGADSLYPTGSSATQSPGLESVISPGGGSVSDAGDGAGTVISPGGDSAGLYDGGTVGVRAPSTLAIMFLPHRIYDYLIYGEPMKWLSKCGVSVEWLRSLSIDDLYSTIFDQSWIWRACAHMQSIGWNIDSEYAFEFLMLSGIEPQRLQNMVQRYKFILSLVGLSTLPLSRIDSSPIQETIEFLQAAYRFLENRHSLDSEPEQRDDYTVALPHPAAAVDTIPDGPQTAVPAISMVPEGVSGNAPCTKVEPESIPTARWSHRPLRNSVTLSARVLCAQAALWSRVSATMPVHGLCANDASWYRVFDRGKVRYRVFDRGKGMGAACRDYFWSFTRTISGLSQ